MKREKTMRLIKNLITTGAFAIIFLGVPAIASAQYGGYGYPNGQNAPYGRNGGYGNGQYGGYGDTRSIVRDLKNRSHALTSQLDRDLDHSRYNGSRREDDLNAMAQDFRNAVNRLSESNSSYGGYGRNDGRMNEVMNRASQLDRALSRARVSYNVQSIWSGIQSDLNALGGGYGGYNRNRNRNGGYNNGRPSWWPF
jgi:hypothetical protein